MLGVLTQISPTFPAAQTAPVSGLTIYGHN